ncbi:MAG: 2-dehydropantoate 2-reductase, partial [Deltaproteobacteria bacterium]|nr:2-dehydropantoate 2-reductase [Deltaproteobacteria bacterium]
TVAALLSEHGAADVVALSSNAAITQAVRDRGFRLRGRDQARTVEGRVVSDLTESEAPFRYVILATQPAQVEAAAREALPFLEADGQMVALQNGLPEARVAEVAGHDRVVGAILAFGASMPEPGVYERTSAGGITLGRVEPRPGSDPDLEALSLLFECIGPTEIAKNFRGARWSKLAINCMISTLGTLAGLRLGEYIRSTKGRYLAFEIITEAVEVARAAGVDLEKVSGTLDLEWLALTDAERRGERPATMAAKHAMLLAVGARYRRLRSSMLAAIERGREPAVDFLNGEVVTRGEALGIPTPVNARAVEMVHDLAAGRRETGMHFVEELARVSPRDRVRNS